MGSNSGKRSLSARCGPEDAARSFFLSSCSRPRASSPRAGGQVTIFFLTLLENAVGSVLTVLSVSYGLGRTILPVHWQAWVSSCTVTVPQWAFWWEFGKCFG